MLDLVSGKVVQYIVSLSGGIGSYITLKRVISKYGKENVKAVFCDTLYEDGDLYLFLEKIEKNLNIEVVRLCSGKTPVQLQVENKFVFNSRVALCSKELKSKVFNQWLKENYTPEECILFMGIDWSEQHRCEAITKNYMPYKVEYPLCEEMLYKQEYFNELKNDGIELPRLYKIGLTHNNCGGRCVKAGIGHWLQLLDKDRNRFIEAENDELALQRIIGNGYTHLKRKGKPYSLHQLRMDKEKQFTIFDFEECNDFGACSCFSEIEEENEEIEEKTK